MTIPVGIYPFSTQDGKAIPLDIINPRGMVFQNYTADAASSFTIPETAEIAAILATRDCIMSFSDNLASIVPDTEYANTLVIPAGVVITSVVIPGTAYIRGIASAGSVFVQLIDKWAGMGLNTQFVRK